MLRWLSVERNRWHMLRGIAVLAVFASGGRYVRHRQMTTGWVVFATVSVVLLLVLVLWPTRVRKEV